MRAKFRNFHKTYDDSTELSVKSISLSLRISFFFLGSLTTAIWMPPDDDGDSGPKVAPTPGGPEPLPAPDDADTVVEDEEMVTSS